MKVKDMITELLEYDMDKEVAVFLEEDETEMKVADDVFIEYRNGSPIIKYHDWRKAVKRNTPKVEDFYSKEFKDMCREDRPAEDISSQNTN